MTDSPSDESQPRQIGAKLTVAIVTLSYGLLGTILSPDLLGTDGTAFLIGDLAAVLFGHIAYIALFAFPAGALAGRHKKSRFWPTAAWVSVALAVLGILGKLAS